MSKVADRIREAIGRSRSRDDRQIADILVDELPRELLLELVAEAVAHQRRLLALNQERSAFHSLMNNQLNQLKVSAGGTPARRALRTLSTTPFALGTGIDVLWGKATVEQHKQRIAMLEKLRGGLDATIARHRAAVAMIEAAGVSNLDEIAARTTAA